MPGKKKKFIDKKNAVTFHLVHRSQRDPLQADDDAPQRVLLPTDSEKENSRKEEERKWGVFFDDGYDYLQHLKDVDELNAVEPIAPAPFTVHKPPVQLASDETQEPSIHLPSSVFGSTTETDVGMLNKAAPVSGPRLDWDPDIVAGLDEDFDYDDPENQLEDDFVIQANDGELNDTEEQEGDLSESEDEAEIFKPYKRHTGPETQQDDDKVHKDNAPSNDVPSDEADISETDSDFEGSDVGSLGEMDFKDMDTKSRFTSYSMSSSVIQRNQGLSLLDDRFEKVYEQYDDDEIGALDQEDIGGFRTEKSQVLNQAMEEFEEQQKQTKLKDAVKKAGVVLDYVSDEEDDEEDLVKMKISEPKEKWDCESILSTHSTLYNHPKLISEPKSKRAIKLTKKAGIPDDVLPTRGLTEKQLEQLSHVDVADRANTIRPKEETSDERRERKKAVKEERKVRREEKKTNKMAFKAEQIRQEKEHINVKQNFQGTTIT